MKTFALAALGAICGYVTGFVGGMFVIEASSTNLHDRSVEAAMTGAFVTGPLLAVIAVIMVVIIRSRRSA